MGTEETAPIAVVLTAVEVEYAAIRCLLTGLRPRRHEAGTVFELGRLPDLDWSVAIARTGVGAVSAAVLTERAIALFRPGAVLFVGVAGALRDDLAYGDVVVATKVYGYQAGQEAQDGFLARPEAWRAPHDLEQLARRVASLGHWTRYLTGSRTIPAVHFQPVAAGDIVLNSRANELANWLRTRYNDAVAIEMESAGVSGAGQLNLSSPVLTIRGISDHADGAKQVADRQGWQAVAAANAAAFAIGLVVELAELSGRAHMAGPRSVTSEQDRKVDLGREKIREWGQTIADQQRWDWHALGHALQYAHEARDLDPSYQRPWTLLADLYHRLGQAERARACLARSRALATPGEHSPGRFYQEIEDRISTGRPFGADGGLRREEPPPWFSRKYQHYLDPQPDYRDGNSQVAIPEPVAEQPSTLIVPRTLVDDQGNGHRSETIRLILVMRETGARFQVEVADRMEIRRLASFLVASLLPDMLHAGYEWTIAHNGRELPVHHTPLTCGLRDLDIISLVGRHRQPTVRPFDA